VLHFNNLLDAVVTGAFLVLVTAIAFLSFREWLLLLARKKVAVLREAAPIWLPDYAVVESKPLHLVSLLALAIALAKELSGEAQLERVELAAAEGKHEHQPQDGVAQNVASKDRSKAYVEMTEQRFKGVRRCC
jgi:hypothetical protein